MTVSGSKNFELDVTEYIEEAFERCGKEVRTGYDIKTAKRSMNLLFADWANRGLNSWTIEQSTQALVAGAVRRDNVDYNIERLSRDDYLGVPNKTTQGRPSQWFLDRLISPVLKLWPVPENSTDVIVFDRLVRMDDADTAQNTVEMPFRFYPCLAAGLAYYIAIKKAPDRVQLLKAVYEEEMERAISMDRDRASFNIVPSLAYSQNL
jgi:hypothetical protein